MKILVALASAAILTGCGESFDNARVTEAGKCDLVIERTVCTPAGKAGAICSRSVIVTTRKTYECGVSS